MSLSSAELGQVLSVSGVGKLPITGGPSSLLKAPIAQTMPFEAAVSAVTLTTAVCSACPIYLPQGVTISNINFVSGSTAESGGSHLWYALYDDGRGSTTANQLALLGQTADQTGAAAFGANTNLGLSLITPYATTYTGYYYVAICCVGTTPTLAGVIRASTAAIQVSAQATGAVYGGTFGSGLTNQAPSPSGAVTATGFTAYAYVS
jgi:hypothetical protein